MAPSYCLASLLSLPFSQTPPYPDPLLPNLIIYNESSTSRVSSPSHSNLAIIKTSPSPQVPFQSYHCLRLSCTPTPQLRWFSQHLNSCAGDCKSLPPGWGRSPSVGTGLGWPRFSHLSLAVEPRTWPPLPRHPRFTCALLISLAWFLSVCWSHVSPRSPSLTDPDDV